MLVVPCRHLQLMKKSKINRGCVHLGTQKLAVSYFLRLDPCGINSVYVTWRLWSKALENFFRGHLSGLGHGLGEGALLDQISKRRLWRLAAGFGDENWMVCFRFRWQWREWLIVDFAFQKGKATLQSIQALLSLRILSLQQCQFGISTFQCFSQIKVQIFHGNIFSL